MKYVSKKYIIVALFIVMMISSACGSNNEDGKEDNKKSDKDKNELTIRTYEDPDFLDPHMMEASITEQILLNVFEGLLSPKQDGSLTEGLAKEYDVSEDKKVYTFTLRDDVFFHNGDPVTASDVKYSFERLTGLNGEDPLTNNFSNMESIDTPDEETVVIHLDEVNSTFTSYLTAKDAAIIPESNDGEHNDNPIGTGPFEFSDYQPGQELVLVKNEDYWVDELPYLNKVTFDVQEDNEVAFLSFQSGELDLLEIRPHRVAEVEDDYHLEYQDNNSTVLIGFNEDKEPFNDVLVRRAINYAINTDDVIEGAYAGSATKIGSNMSPAMGDVYKEGLEDAYEYDVEKAKKLLEEAGYPDGFKTTITVSSHSERYTDIAQVAVENLKEIGIDVEIEVVEWGVWLDDVYQGRDYEMTAIDFTGKLSPYDILDRYISDNDNNFMNFSNEEYDELMETVLREEDEDKQIEIYQRAQEILSEEAAAVFLADHQFIWLMDKNLEGFKKYPIFYIDLSELRYKN